MLTGIDLKWGEIETWGAIKRASGPTTSLFLLAALDLKRRADGRLVGAPREEAIFVQVLGRTFAIAIVVTVLSTLAGFDRNLLIAAASLGSPPWLAFRKVALPIIFPGVFSGALFAFATSFDEVVVALLLTGPGQRTLPRQMFAGINDNISLTITAAGTLLVLLACLLLVAAELLRRRSERLRLRPPG